MEESNPLKTHPWIYVIIPITPGYPHYSSDGEFTPGSYPLFSAFCKDCRTYYTEPIPVSETGLGMLSRSNLPRTGCIPVTEDEGFSSLPGIDRKF